MDTTSLIVGATTALCGVFAMKMMGGGSSKSAPSGDIKYWYFPIAGRGEICRLIAAVGGLDNFKEMGAKHEDKKSFGSPSGIPLLEHGDLKMSQSLAIEAYLSLIAPLYAELSPQQRAIDGLFAGIKEDLLAGCAKVLFGDKSTAPEEIPKVLKRYLPCIEAKLPSSGFVNGEEFPTIADFCCLQIFHGAMPFTQAYGLADINVEDIAKDYPKLASVVEKTAAYPSVAAYLAKKDCPMGGVF